MYVYTKKEVIVLSDPRLISPLLDGFALGSSISCHSGVQCYPAMRNDSDERYIVKTISIPPSQVQLEALLLTGAYANEEAAKGYFQVLAKDVRDEVEILDRLAARRGFLPYSKYQIVPLEEGVGYEVFLLSPYKRSLERQFRAQPLTHLAAVNMGIDLCAALSVCREAGYLYVDLKPGNIFLSDGQEYQIGDLGFMDLASLDYASLPDRYRSVYVPPEICDAYATLNTTMDTYSLGLVLYQVFNNGALPFDSEESRKAMMEQGEPLPPPAYADYEMAEIILKACAFAPEDRWKDPIEMGHALIAYMQRNAVNDVPIIPPVVEVTPAEDDEDPPQESPDAELSEDAEVETEIPEDTPDEDAPDEDAEDEGADKNVSSEEEPQPDTDAPESEESEDWIDRMGTILDEDSTEETDGTDEPSLRELLESDEDAPLEIPAEELTGEAAEILSQAQELLDHPAPDPVIPPEPIDIPMPDPILPQEDEDDEDTADAPSEDTPDQTAEADAAPSEPNKSKRSVKKIVVSVVALIAAAAVIFGGYYCYKNYYLVPITDFSVTGKDDVMTVSVQTQRDNSLITVVCKDNFGNVSRAPLENGQATFKALMPSSQYLVSLEVEKFHKLTGEIGEQTYATPTRTQVVSMAATAGPEDGSAVVNFAVEGPDSKTWTLHYSTEGEEEKTYEFSGHTATVTGLTLGKTYTFRLSAADDVFLIGENSLSFFSGELIYAENATAYLAEDGSLNVSWTAPEGAEVESWSVRCFNDSGFDQTQEVTATGAVFTNPAVASACTVEITAKGMSQATTLALTAKPVTITNLNATASATSIDVNWQHLGPAPESGWMVLCTPEGSDTAISVPTSETGVTVYPVAPGTRYQISVQAGDQTSVFSKSVTVDTAAISEEFSGYRLSASDISISAYLCPDYEDWGRGDLGESTTTFAPQSKMALVYYTPSIYDLSATELTTLFVIRNAEGKTVSVSSSSRTWDDMWEGGYCEDEVRQLPGTSGSYTLEVYLDSMLLGKLNFTIS